MSTEYCPVYAPFFGAMVGCCCEFVRIVSISPLINRGARVPSCSLVSVPFTLNSYPTDSASCRHRSQVRFVLGLMTIFQCLFSYGTAKSGVGISAMSVLRPDLMIKCSIPVVMAGIIAVSGFNLEHNSQVLTNIQIYGLVVSVLISSKCSSKTLFIARLPHTDV